MDEWTWSVTAESSDERGEGGILLKIGCPVFEVNIWLAVDEASLVHRAAETDWMDGSAKIGRIGGDPAYWSCDSSHLSILAGDDDEMWHTGFTLPRQLLTVIVQEIASNASRVTRGDSLQ